MEKRGIGRATALALALLPVAVVAYGLGLPFDDSPTLGLNRPSYYLILLGTISVAYVFLLRVTDRLWARSHETVAALTDRATMLPGSELFRDRLQQVLLLSEREGAHVPLIAMGLDRFDEISHAFGRERSEAVLRLLAERLRTTLRDSDTVARIGGDEFAVLLPSTPDGSGALTVVHKIRHALEESVDVDGIPVELTATFGVALSPGHGNDADTLLHHAAVAMAAARRSGTRYEFFSPEKHAPNTDGVALVAELRRAIEERQLVLFYQPKSSLDGGAIKGVEALVRWMHPERGLVPPDEFIPLAEQTELMKPLTLYVLDEALAQLDEWRARGLRISVAVNISARNLMDLELPDDVQTLLERYEVPAHALELEVTESTVVDDQSRAILVMERLSRMGVRIAIDDYGAGYTSLTYLTRLPVASLKIDKSFVQNITEQHRDALIVRSTIDLARDLGLEVVAEGVETVEVWDELARLGCGFAQGYYVSRPLPADELVLV